MRVRKSLIRDLILKSLLKESSEQAFNRFAKKLRNLSYYSNTAINRAKKQGKSEEFLSHMKFMQDALTQSIQGDFPGSIDIDEIDEIVDNAIIKYQSDPSKSLEKHIIDGAEKTWSANIGASRADKGAADPRARGVVAQSIDRSLKYAWKKEADQPENKEFWDNFEVWHSIGGIVGRGEGFEHEKVLGFLEAFKTSNPNEMSAYGWDGRFNGTDEEKINGGILNIINTAAGWKNHAHVKLEGDITFAANFDLTTQWYQYKEEGKDFEKSGDLSKIMMLVNAADSTSGLITGPEDPLLPRSKSISDYNEIVIKNSKVSAIALPDEFFTPIKALMEGQIGRVNLSYLGRLISNGDYQTANEELIDAADDMYRTSSGDDREIIKILKAMLTSDRSELEKDVADFKISNMTNILKYLEYNIPIYDIRGNSKNDYVLKQAKYFKACLDFIENNPEAKSRKSMTWGEYVKKTFKPDGIKKLQVTLGYLDKKKVVDFIKSEKGREWFEYEQAVQYSGQRGVVPTILPKSKVIINQILNAKNMLKENIPYSNLVRKSTSLPLWLDQLIFIGNIIKRVENNNDPDHPFKKEKEKPKPRPRREREYYPPNPPPVGVGEISLSQRSSSEPIQPPYFMNISWFEPGEGDRSFQDNIYKTSNYEDYQENPEVILSMLNGIHNRGGKVHYFGLYDKQSNSFVQLKTKNDILSIVQNKTKNIAEVKLTRRQIRQLIRKIL